MGFGKIWLQNQLRLDHFHICPIPYEAHLLLVWMAPAVILPITYSPNYVLQQLKHKSITRVLRLCACHQQCISFSCTALPPRRDSIKNSICPEVLRPGWALEQCTFQSRIWDEGYTQRCSLVPVLSSFCLTGSQRRNSALASGYSKVSCLQCC